MPGEFDFIKEIQKKAAAQSAADLVLGIGDDAAIWREQAGRESLITVDLLVEDVDFKLEYAPPRWLGHKALAVSLSDIAAMGAEPKFSLLTLAIPKNNPQSAVRNPQFWQEFFAGYFELATKHGVVLIGGDISSSPDRLAIDSMVIGHCQAGKAIRRDGAKAGNEIYVTGSIGASAAGLKLLLGGERVGENVCSSAFRRSRLQPSEDGTLNTVESAIRAHLKPEPRVEFGRRLGELGLATAMIDVSDGLAQDLAHICEASNVSAVIDFYRLPIAETVGLVTKDDEEAFDFAVNGGEDFELLFTAQRRKAKALGKLAESCGLTLTQIGEIRAADSHCPVWLARGCLVTDLPIRGYDHFGV